MFHGWDLPLRCEGLQDTGNGFIWTDQEMADFFPALAQMPLGLINYGVSSQG